MSAIINTLQYKYGNLHKSHSAALLFLDFLKVFVYVDHGILSHKSRVYGVLGLTFDWFRSYLKNRQQNVTFKNKLSNRFSIECNVPQSFAIRSTALSNFH